ncbi:MAG: 2-nitropropane dioxygenase [Parcubacteria group bacterium LiPW_41]|nr:MAG: 2-nitropropane dioxygenase [Parcubacteria group bacterium LiPW_41]
MERLPLSSKIIQGGMGVNISGWRLARTNSLQGQLGTVSGVVLERVLARQLQMGDPGGHLRRALSHFPFPSFSKEVEKHFYVEGGIAEGTQFKAVPMFTINPSKLLISLTVCANFAFVWLAKENNPNPVSINYLEKVSMPHIYAITGAMLAGVDFITMGAGIPFQIPNVIESIAEGKPVTYRIPVIGNKIKNHTVSFEPEKFFGEKLPISKKPGFIPIIASNRLANILSGKLPKGSISAFVVELWTAGGHNAPPVEILFGTDGKPLPIYGEKDLIDYKKLTDLGIPWYLGGSQASPEKLQWALSVGASGIQAGSIYALCDESDMYFEIKKTARKLGFQGKLIIRTDMLISPTGFPFKVAVLFGTLSEHDIYESRIRICNQGALVSLYEREDGLIGYRCPAEPIDQFIRKGGDISETFGRGCLCNGLGTTGGVGNYGEPAIMTLGDDLSFLLFLMKDENDSYSAQDATNYLLGY